MKIQFKHILRSLLLLVPFIMTGCQEDEENNTPLPDFNAKGVYIVNEGAFGAGNASITYYNIEDETVSSDIYNAANGIPLGDVAQSMTIKDSTGYIVVNNSQKVEVVNLNTFDHLTTINGFSGPRHMVTYNLKGFVSDWFADEVKVVDLSTNTIVQSISTGTGPDEMCIANHKLYVVNVGGFGSDSTVTVIDPVSLSVLSTIPVGINPNSIAEDLNGGVWVLCGGSLGPDYTPGTSDDIEGTIWKINPASLTATKVYTFTTSTHPIKLRADGDKRYMYFLRGSSSYSGIITKFDAVPANVAIVNVINKTFYGLGVDPVSGHLYGGVAPDFTSNGKVFRYSGTGELKDSIQAGIAPGYFVFKK